MTIKKHIRLMLEQQVNYLRYKFGRPYLFFLLKSNCYTQPKIKSLRKLRSLMDTKCLFVHIPKTGGISIVTALFGGTAGNHSAVIDYKVAFGVKRYNDFFKFTFVRNPWDRLVSAYVYMRDGGRNNEDKKWSQKYLKQYNDFDDFVMNWVNRKNIYKGIHFVPQYRFLSSSGKQPQVDFIGHFETLREDYNYVKNKLNTGSTLECWNKTDKKKDYKDYYSKATRDKVALAYREDIEIFGYDFEGLRNPRH